MFIFLIGMDIHGDVHVNDDGTIDMNSPFEMFGGDRLYAKNGEVYLLPIHREMHLHREM